MSLRPAQSTSGLLLCMVFYLGNCVAAVPERPEPLPLNPLDEVVVEGRRAELGELKRRLVELEDEFYRLYNQVNDKDQFDVHCAVEIPTGSRVARRFCRARFVMEARSVEAKHAAQYLQGVTGNAPMPAGSVPEPAPAIIAIEMRRPEFRANMIRVVEKNQKLLALLRKRAALAERYERAGGR